MRCCIVTDPNKRSLSTLLSKGIKTWKYCKATFFGFMQNLWFYSTKKYEDHVLHLGARSLHMPGLQSLCHWPLHSTRSLQLFHPNPHQYKLLSYEVQYLYLFLYYLYQAKGRKMDGGLLVSLVSQVLTLQAFYRAVVIPNMPHIDLSRFWSRFAFPKPACRLRHAKTTTLHVSIMSVDTLYIYNHIHIQSCWGVFTAFWRLSYRVHNSALRHAWTKAKRRLPTSVGVCFRPVPKYKFKSQPSQQLLNAVHHVQSQPLSPCRLCPCCFVPIENIRIH